MSKILLIDDDPSIQLALSRVLTKEGYDFVYASTGEEGLAVLDREHPDLLLLDIMIPGMNGYDVCRTMREKGRRIPVIFLSAKGDIVDKSIGFKAGGDDYMVKPFDTSELLLRIEAHMRRHRDDLTHAKETAQGGNATLGDLEVHFSNYEVRKKGVRIDLTGKEFEILALLAANPGKVFTRQQIYEHIWGYESAVDTNSVTVFIRRIREKLEEEPSQPAIIQTVWGVGYRFGD